MICRNINVFKSGGLLQSAILIFGITCSWAVHALTVPFTEDFTADSSKWLNSNGSALLGWNSTGGPDGSSFVSGTFNFKDSPATIQGPAVLRATTSILGQSSNGAFFGDWLTGGVGGFSAWVHHDANVPLHFFTRFAGPNNFPGGAAVEFVPVPSGVWTELTVAIDATNPQFVWEGPGSNLDSIFSALGQLQIGVSVPDSLAGVDREISFGLDQPALALVPEPAALLLAGLGLLILSGRQCNLSRSAQVEAL